MSGKKRPPIRMAKPRLATVPAEIATRFVAPHGAKRTVVGRHLTDRRKRIRALFALCCMCHAQGIVRPFDEVDHRHALEDGGPDTQENCWGLCHACHVLKTNAEEQRRARGEDCSKPLDWLPPRPAELDRGPTIA